MTTTQEDVNGWIKEGRKKNAHYLIVVCDTFSYEDFPVYAYSEEDKQEKQSYHSSQPMSRIMETIKL